ncbi:MAG: hypothetical protein LBJ93_03875 [Clostridiales bacterium]|jgi:hypothetical protein|nr:hypothetical protein [Clostridiales bacterium]
MQGETQTDLDQQSLEQKRILKLKEEEAAVRSMTVFGPIFMLVGSGMIAASSVEFHKLTKLNLALNTHFSTVPTWGIIMGSGLLIIGAFAFVFGLINCKQHEGNKKTEEDLNNEQTIAL